MDPITIGALIAGATSLIGGAVGSNAQQVAAGQSADVAANNQRLQLLMAQSGVTMRADDIMNAYSRTGIHPLALLGVNAPSYTPVNYVGSGASPMGDAIHSSGQNIARAVMASGTEEARMKHASRMDGLVMERAGLENELLRMRIASEMATIRQASSPPAMPIGANWLMDGQGNVTRGAVVNKAMERIAPGSNVTAEPGAVTDVGFSRTREGWAPTRSKDLQDRAEDDAIGSITWNVRNRMLPSLGLDYNPPFPAPAGKRWVYHAGRQEYQLIDGSPRMEGWDPSSPYRSPYGGRR